MVAVGGCDAKDNTLQVCEIYDMETDEWTKLPDLNVKRSSHASCVVNDSDLYVFCGLNKFGAATNIIESLEVPNGR